MQKIWKSASVLTDVIFCQKMLARMLYIKLEFLSVSRPSVHCDSILFLRLSDEFSPVLLHQTSDVAYVNIHTQKALDLLPCPCGLVTRKYRNNYLMTKKIPHALNEQDASKCLIANTSLIQFRPTKY